jgi:hypothetical protein
MRTLKWEDLFPRIEREVEACGQKIISGEMTLSEATQSVADIISYNNGGPATRQQIAEAEGYMEKYLSIKGFDPEAQKKKEGREFARAQVDKIIAMGFPKGRAVAIMKAAGPGRAVEAAEWAIKAYSVIPNADAFDVVLGNISGTNGFGKDRVLSVLSVLGFPVPAEESASSRRVFAVLAGARVAIDNGLPPTILFDHLRD